MLTVTKPIGTKERDRKTVRAYINGDRTPGQRRDDRRDPLAPFAA